MESNIFLLSLYNKKQNMDYNKIEQLTGLNRKINYDYEMDQVMDEDIEHMVELYESLTDEEEVELYKILD